MKLSILCVTRAEPFAEPFLTAMAELAGDLEAELAIVRDGVDVHSSGYIESVLDEALGFCTGDYVLRLDDDERCSPAMVDWLASGKWASRPSWKFCRQHLWGDERHFIITPQLWPDHQSRLAHRSLSGGRITIHAGSPHGGGELAPCAMVHAKFLVKSLEERRAIVRRYDAIQPGAGTNFAAFSVPEDVYEEAAIAEVGDGSIRDVAVAFTRLRERVA